MTKTDRFFIACLRDTVGTNMAFHGEGWHGYPTDIAKAQVLNREQAQKFWDSAREFDLPVCADLVEQQARFRVDCQYIPSESLIEPGCEAYVGYLKGQWDGNDVYWVTETDLNGYTVDADFSKALVLRQPLNLPNVVWLPYSLANEKKRRTFPIELLNKRTMVQSYGLRTPAHIKRSSRKKASSGKVRWNCPGCGKISWQHNPHDFEQFVSAFPTLGISQGGV